MIYRLFFKSACISLLLCGCTRVWDPYEEPFTTSTLSGSVNEGRYFSPSGVFSLSIPKNTENLLVTDDIIIPRIDQSVVYFTEVSEKNRRITAVGFTPADPLIPPELLPPIRELMLGPAYQILTQPFQVISGFEVMSTEFLSLNNDEQCLITARSIREQWCNPDAQADFVVWVFLVGRHPKGCVTIMISDMPIPRLKLNMLDTYCWDELKQSACNLFLSFQ